jgi:hypothetical protein
MGRGFGLFQLFMETLLMYLMFLNISENISA